MVVDSTRCALVLDTTPKVLMKLSALGDRSVEDLHSNLDASDSKIASAWHPEYGRYMLEGTPAHPYGPLLSDLLTVLPNMQARRRLANSLLEGGQSAMTLTHFPRMGCEGWSWPYLDPTPFEGYSTSMFLNDNVIGLHARFRTLTANIRKRRGEKVVINIPIYKDIATPWPFREPLPVYLNKLLTSVGKPVPPSIPEFNHRALENHIYMDCMAFGMGSSCLQVTFQACSIEQARRLYDQLTTVTPLMLALSASSPIYRGYLADIDCRWNVIAASVDDRNEEERTRIAKSRYESVSVYLSPGPNVSGGCEKYPLGGPAVGSAFFKDSYNDLNPVYDKDILAQLVAGGVDEHLAKHYAHLFIRDPLVVYEELIDQNPETSSDHFEVFRS